MTLFDFLPTGGQFNLASKTLKRAPRALELVSVGLNLAVFVPGHSRRFPVTHLDFWPPGSQFIHKVKPSKSLRA